MFHRVIYNFYNMKLFTNKINYKIFQLSLEYIVYNYYIYICMYISLKRTGYLIMPLPFLRFFLSDGKFNHLIVFDFELSYGVKGCPGITLLSI